MANGEGQQNSSLNNAQLTQYQVCQQETDSRDSSYWTLASIFIGIASVFLAGLIFAIVSNDMLLSDWIQTNCITASRQVWLLRILTPILGLGVICILWQLKRWNRRAGFLIHVNFETMRDIERLPNSQLSKNWRIHAIDNWDDPQKVSKEDKDWFISNVEPEDWVKGWRNSCAYEEPSTRFFDRILITIATLWALSILIVWIFPWVMFRLGM